MTYTVLFPNGIIKSFARNPLPAVRKDQTYSNLSGPQKYIKDDHNFIESLWGWVYNGLCGGTSSNTRYDTVAQGTPFGTPTHPGVASQTVVGTTKIASFKTLLQYTW